MRKGFYAGSFDPFTNGHLHIVKLASCVFDEVVIGIGINPAKNRRYDKYIMKNAIDAVLKREGLNNVGCVIYDGYTAKKALDLGCNFLIRGVRNGSDYTYEENIATINKKEFNLDTIYFRAGELGNVSSSMVFKELQNGADVSKFVPLEVLKIISTDKCK